MISVSEARRLVLARTRPLPAARVRVDEALGLVLARDVIAPFDLPRFTTSAMDGFALPSRASSGATSRSRVRLRLARRTVVAGSGPGAAIQPGHAIRIMTGAPLPRGVDAVLPQEEAWIEDGALLLSTPVRTGAFVRPAAEDFRRGARVVAAGSRVGPGTIAVLSALGVDRVEVRRPPRVAIVVTGDEVRPSGRGAPPPWSVRDSHAAFLRAALRGFRIEPVLVSRARDRAREIRARLSVALSRADLVLVTGGVSVGARDLVRPVLATLGVREVFWGVAQTPGRPLFFGLRRGAAVFGLPGNPASTIVCYCQYVAPAIRGMLGYARPLPAPGMARPASPLPPAGPRTRFLRGRLQQGGRFRMVSVVGGQASHLLGAFIESDCLIEVPAAVTRRRRGPSPPGVRVHPYPWERE